ncbi:carboxymuconolactone decarboxylase family protein [Allomuricauda sp. NBRC 101325]|uniref:carboxymuconolactone decarboxylase family protein n=1 Tax=Allomuricauda sp. NBRC 101325 TaxID=1113758 RepID=UPI00249FC8DD|nr:carboxymuconolactone decarboxylase family protein [Muricauda sp. NBRC 101325]GLU45252.1 hypothetical protein Musp01_28760 [Muricauda sp. NBRC 101325]
MKRMAPDGMFDELKRIDDFIHRSSLDLQLLELMRLRVAQLNDCAFCVQMHTKELIKIGESEKRVTFLSSWCETVLFTEKERATLKFAESLTNLSEKSINKANINLLSDYFTIDEIWYLTLAICQINTWTRVMKVFPLLVE